MSRGIIFISASVVVSLVIDGIWKKQKNWKMYFYYLIIGNVTVDNNFWLSYDTSVNKSQPGVLLKGNFKNDYKMLMTSLFKIWNICRHAGWANRCRHLLVDDPIGSKILAPKFEKLRIFFRLESFFANLARTRESDEGSVRQIERSGLPDFLLIFYQFCSQNFFNL